MATIEQLSTALRNAHNAGDVEAAKKLAGAIRQMQEQPQQQPEEQPQQPAPVSQEGSAINPLMQGATFGFADEIAGVLGGTFDAATGRRSFSEGYARTRDNARRQDAGFSERNPKTAVALEIAGALPTAAIPIGAAARGASLGGRVMQGARAGAAAGGLYGVGAANGDMTDRALGGVKGAVAGGLTGGAIPMVTAGVSAAARPIRDAVTARTNPAGYAARKVTERLGNQNMTVNQAASRIGRARQAGQNMSLMDVGGDSLRDLARTTTNVPGPARNRLTANANLGAMAQGDRLKNLVGTTLGDPDGYLAAKDRVVAARAQAATPYYNRAWRTPITYSHELESLLQRPSVREALSAAKRNALDAGDDPAFQQWLARVADDGTVQFENVPGLKDLHFVKRALDALYEGSLDKSNPFRPGKTGLYSPGIGKARDQLRGLMNAAGETAPGRADGPYARASRVALDNIQADEALEFGRDALARDARLNARQVARMNDGQRELARVGVAEALRKRIDEAGMTHNAILRFFSSREQVARLRPFFSDDEWRTFRTAIFNEARRRKSYNALQGNSTTARQLLDAQEAGALGEVAGTAAQAANGGILGASIDLVVKAARRAGGLTPRTAEEMARLLATRDPQQLRRITNTLARVEATRASAQHRMALTRSILSNLVAGQEGRLLAAPTNPQ